MKRRSCHRLVQVSLAAATHLGKLVIPPRCAFCGVLTEASEGALCVGCHNDLPWQTASCPRCALAVATELVAGVTCATCQARPPPFESAIAPLEYAFPVDAAIKALKFQRRMYYVPAFVDLLVAASSRLPGDIDVVVPVPLHRWRYLRRGFNQARELAVPIARHLRVPILDSVSRRRATPYQSGLSARERKANLRNAFACRGPLRPGHALIVDDVITTGETCRQLAETLLGAGASRVSVLAVARA